MQRETDLNNAQAPEDVADILRCTADKYRDSVGELQAAWQPNPGDAGKIWGKIAQALEACAKRCDKICKG